MLVWVCWNCTTIVLLLAFFAFSGLLSSAGDHPSRIYQQGLLLRELDSSAFTPLRLNISNPPARLPASGRSIFLLSVILDPIRGGSCLLLPKSNISTSTHLGRFSDTSCFALPDFTFPRRQRSQSKKNNNKRHTQKKQQTPKINHSRPTGVAQKNKGKERRGPDILAYWMHDEYSHAHTNTGWIPAINQPGLTNHKASTTEVPDPKRSSKGALGVPGAPNFYTKLFKLSLSLERSSQLAANHLESVSMLLLFFPGFWAAIGVGEVFSALTPRFLSGFL